MSKTHSSSLSETEKKEKKNVEVLSIDYWIMTSVIFVHRSQLPIRVLLEKDGDGRTKNNLLFDEFEQVLII